MKLTLIFVALILTAMPLTFFYIIPLLYSGIHYEKTTFPKIKIITKLLSEQIIHRPKNSKNHKLNICDLGSGNGNILIHLAKNLQTHKLNNLQTYFTGLEINPFLTSFSKHKIKKEKLNHKIKIKQKNFWKQPLKEFNIIIVFQFKTLMEKLENKIRNECKKGTIIISNNWEFPTLKKIKTKNKIHIYKI
jgi:hypothetical protein